MVKWGMSSYKNYLPPIMCAGFIFILSLEVFGDKTTFGILHYLLGFVDASMSKHKMKEIDFYIRKTAHIVVYATLAVLWFRAFMKSGKSIPAAVFLTFTFSLLCAGLDEYHQSLVPGRTGLVSDVYIDITGAGTALVISAIKTKTRHAFESVNCKI